LFDILQVVGRAARRFHAALTCDCYRLREPEPPDDRELPPPPPLDLPLDPPDDRDPDDADDDRAPLFGEL